MSKRIVVLGILVSLLVAPVSYAETKDQREARLRAELAKIEVQIVQQQVILDVKSGERQSLERDVAVLDGQINKAQLAIRQRNLTISQITSDVQDREQAIRELDKKIAREKASLSQLLRKTNEIDNLSFTEMILGSNDLSDLFVDIDSFEVVKISLSQSFELIAAAKESIQGQKETLQEEQFEERELREIQVFQKNKVESRKGEKNKILTVTKGQEEIYQEILNESKKSAAEIRSTLFSLRGTAAIPFGDAYDFAKEASGKTGVRPALILAILKQETNLGENVGQCLLTNSPNKGDGKGKNTGRAFDQVMKGTRDVDPFMDIVSELGLDPYSQVVSCPPSYGYGGAMGPAQFIPSTWVLYKKSLGKITRQKPPNPWDPRTAIFATSLLMKDNGADQGSYFAERLAALRYFAGWRNAKKAAYAFYGDDVMELVEVMQNQIDILEG